MNIRLFTACTLAAMLLPAAAHAADTPAVAVVREFLADRAAGNSAAAYALLSAKSRQGSMTEATFAAGGKIPKSVPAGVSAPLFGLLILLGDTHNTLGYTFAVLGPDPANPRAVLVHASPPAGKAKLPASTVRLLTVSDSGTHTPGVDVIATMESAAPQVFAGVRKNVSRVMSQNNLKELSLGIIQYEQDHDELAPDANKWVDQIMPYVNSKAAFQDPAAPSTPWGYAYNRTLSHQSLAMMENPASTVMLFESTKGVKNASDTGQSVPHPGRHRDQNNLHSGTDYAFADGHVKWFKDGTKLSYRLDGK